MDDSPGSLGFNRSFTLLPWLKRTFCWNEFPEEQGLHLVVPDSPPHQKFVNESPMVHTPKTEVAVHKIEPEKQSSD